MQGFYGFVPRQAMWYDAYMVTEADIISAQAAIDHAQNVRAYHRRRTERRNVQRIHDIRMARSRLETAMRPIRAQLGRPVEHDEELYEISQAIQREKRKLWKMQPKKKKR